MNIELSDILPGDMELLEGWIAREHVVRRWPGVSVDELMGAQHNAIIVADGVKAGYIQWQNPTREELDVAGLADIPETMTDIDIFLGEERLLRRGIGSAAVSFLVSRICNEDAATPGFMACAAVDNEASINMFKKVGFRKDREFEDVPYGRYALMFRERRPGG